MSKYKINWRLWYWRDSSGYWIGPNGPCESHSGGGLLSSLHEVKVCDVVHSALRLPRLKMGQVIDPDGQSWDYIHVPEGEPIPKGYIKVSDY